MTTHIWLTTPIISKPRTDYNHNEDIIIHVNEPTTIVPRFDVIVSPDVIGVYEVTPTSYTRLINFPTAENYKLYDAKLIINIISYLVDMLPNTVLLKPVLAILRVAYRYTIGVKINVTANDNFVTNLLDEDITEIIHTINPENEDTYLKITNNNYDVLIERYYKHEKMLKNIVTIHGRDIMGLSSSIKIYGNMIHEIDEEYITIHNNSHSDNIENLIMRIIDKMRLINYNAYQNSIRPIKQKELKYDFEVDYQKYSDSTYDPADDRLQNW